MRKQTFNKIKKTLAILLAVFFVITFTAASASACAAKVADNNLANKVVNDGSGTTEDQKTALGNQLLDWADNNWFGQGNGNDGGCDNGFDNGLFGNDGIGSCDSCDNGIDNGLFGNDW